MCCCSGKKCSETCVTNLRKCLTHFQSTMPSVPLIWLLVGSETTRVKLYSRCYQQREHTQQPSRNVKLRIHCISQLCLMIRVLAKMGPQLPQCNSAAPVALVNLNFFNLNFLFPFLLRRLSFFSFSRLTSELRVIYRFPPSAPHQPSSSLSTTMPIGTAYLLAGCHLDRI